MARGIGMRWQIIKVPAVVFWVLVLGACSVVQREPQDGGPPTPVDVSHVQDARPAPVIRTRAGNAGVYTVLGKTYRVMSDSRGYRERGVASWYGTKFHGRRTANGEVYDMFAMTAAHKTLPIPSYVRVTHVGNGRSVVVKINDRGPFHDNRIIDLSYAAARKLGVDATGTGLVDVVDVTPEGGQDRRQVVAAPQSVTIPTTGAIATPAVTPAPVVSVITPTLENTSNIPSQVLVDSSNLFYIQIGAFQQRQTALSLQAQVASILTESVNIIQGQDRLHRVTVGPVADEQQIPVLQQRLHESGFEKGYVVRQGIKK